MKLPIMQNYFYHIQKAFNINDINYTITFNNANKKIFYRKNQLIKQIINEFPMEYIHNFYIYLNGV